MISIAFACSFAAPRRCYGFALGIEGIEPGTHLFEQFQGALASGRWRPWTSVFANGYAPSW
jgi:hypothetical protein